MSMQDFAEILQLFLVAFTIVNVWLDRWDRATFFGVMMCSNQIGMLAYNLVK